MYGQAEVAAEVDPVLLPEGADTSAVEQPILVEVAEVAVPLSSSTVCWWLLLLVAMVQTMVAISQAVTVERVWQPVWNEEMGPFRRIPLAGSSMVAMPREAPLVGKVPMVVLQMATRVEAAASAAEEPVAAVPTTAQASALAAAMGLRGPSTVAAWPDRAQHKELEVARPCREMMAAV